MEINQKTNKRVGQIVVKTLDVVKLFRVTKFKNVVELNQKWNRELVLYIIYWNGRLNTACSEIVKCSEIAKKNVEEMNQKRYKS